MIKIFIFVFQHWWNRYWGSHFWHLSVQTVSHNYYMYNRKVLVFIYHCFFQLGNQIIHFEKKIGKSFGILHDFKIICIGKCAYKSTKPALKNHCLIHVLNIMLCKKKNIWRNAKCICLPCSPKTNLWAWFMTWDRLMMRCG